MRGVASNPPLPWASLLILAATVFIAIISEMLPTGLLVPMADDLGVRESGAGLLVTVYAVASGLTAIPLIAATRSVSRHRLLLIVLVGFVVVNLATAITTSYAVMVVVRIAGGICTGLIWSMVGGYAAQLVPEGQRGRALAVALGGSGIAFTTGLPASAAIGTLLGWRVAFAILGALGIIAVFLILRVLPPVDGEPETGRLPFGRVVRLPGIATIAVVVIVLVVGQYSLYTYIEPFVTRAGLRDGASLALFAFGFGSLGGLWLTGRVIDGHLRLALILSVAAMIVLQVGLGALGTSVVFVLLLTFLWGLAYGGLTPIMQTAAVRAGGAAADVAVSVVVTAWSLGIAGGAVLGGVFLDAEGAGVLPWVTAALLAGGLAVVLIARRAFPDAAPAGERDETAVAA